MRNKLILPVVALCCTLPLVAGACSKDNEAAKGKSTEATTTTTSKATTTTTTEAPTDSVVDVIVADNDLSQFSGLLTMAGLDTTLAEGGPYTIIAPTNAALSAVPAATMASLQQDPRGALANVLKLHILSGNVTWDALAGKAGSCVDTLGGKVKVELNGTGDKAVVDFGGAPVPNQKGVTAANGTLLKADGVTTAPATSC